MRNDIEAVDESMISTMIICVEGMFCAAFSGYNAVYSDKLKVGSRKSCGCILVDGGCRRQLSGQGCLLQQRTRASIGLELRQRACNTASTQHLLDSLL